MRNSRRARLFWLSLALVVVVSAVTVLRQLTEPSFEGKSLATWASELDYSHEDEMPGDPAEGIFTRPSLPASAAVRHHAAVQALRQMEEAATKYALKLCRSKDSSSLPPVVEWIQRLAGLDAGHDSPAWEKRMKAVAIFRALGESAKPAIPSLKSLLRDEATADVAQLILSRVEPEGVEVLRDHLTHSNAAVRSAATFGFAHPWTRSYARNILTELVRQAHDPAATVRWSAIHALANIPDEPTLIVPILVSRLEDESLVQNAAARALDRFGEETLAHKKEIIQLIEQGRLSVVAAPRLVTNTAAITGLSNEFFQRYQIQESPASNTHR